MKSIGFHTFENLLYEHWVSAFLILVTLTTICVVLVLRWYVRRRLRIMLESRFGEEHELDLLPSPGPREQKSMELIAEMREKVWDLPEGELQLGMEALNRRALFIVQAIGAVYYPESEQPEYQASLTDTLELVKRVSHRLTRLSSTVPFKYIGDRKLSDFQRYYGYYQKINDSPVLKLFRNHRNLYKAARLVLNVKNMANPLYWAGKELTREGYFFILRWFYLTFTSEIGKEAIRLYSGKRFQQEEDRDAVLVCYRLFHTMRKWSGPSPEEWAAFVRFVADHSAIDSDGKLHILSRCSEDRLPKDVEEQKIVTSSGIKWYKEGLKKLLNADSGPSPAKAKLIERETQEQAG
ncbi:MAG: hypothetical protein AB9866_23950 [Syntrophobacteraceae bacterium]